MSKNKRLNVAALGTKELRREECIRGRVSRRRRRARAENATVYKRLHPVSKADTKQNGINYVNMVAHSRPSDGSRCAPCTFCSIGALLVPTSNQNANKAHKMIQPLRHRAPPSRQALASSIHAIECFVFVQCCYHAFDSALARQTRNTSRDWHRNTERGRKWLSSAASFKKAWRASARLILVRRRLKKMRSAQIGQRRHRVQR
jgi:hypothetical protein